jgi:hypothetical protein
MHDRLLFSAAAVTFAALLGGCAGGASPSTSGAVPLGDQGSASAMSAQMLGAGSKLKVTPTTMTFTTRKHQQATLSPNTDFYTQKNTCVKKHILKSVTYFDYGIWTVTPGATKGNCSVTFTDTVTGGMATMKVINNI